MQGVSEQQNKGRRSTVWQCASSTRSNEATCNSKRPLVVPEKQLAINIRNPNLAQTSMPVAGCSDSNSLPQPLDVTGMGC